MKRKLHRLDKETLIGLLDELMNAAETVTYTCEKTIRHLELMAFVAERKETAATEGRYELAHRLSEVEQFLWTDEWTVVNALQNETAGLWKSDFFQNQFVLLFSLLTGFENNVLFDPRGKYTMDLQPDDIDRYVGVVRLLNSDDIIYGWNTLQATDDDYRRILSKGMRKSTAISPDSLPRELHRLTDSREECSILITYHASAHPEEEAKHIFTNLEKLSDRFVSTKLAVKNVNLLDPLVSVILY